MSGAPDAGVKELRAAVTSLCSDYGTATTTASPGEASTVFDRSLGDSAHG